MFSRFWTWLFRSQTLQFLLIVLLIVLAVVFVVVMSSENPEWIFDLLGVAEKGEPNEKGEPKYEVLKFLGIGMGGVLVALQALMSYKRAKAMEDTAQAQADAANAQARATEEQAKANQHTEQGQQQERFRNAIEHLGHKKDSVRLGGAYELFHLAQDTEGLRQTVLDILCAHIRQTTGEYEYQKKHKVPEDVDPEDAVSKPSEEVQSLLNLLFVQDHGVFKGLRADLGGSWMGGADLRTARLESSVLVGVDLQEANLTRANLQGANLDGAQLQGANLEGANLQKANITWTQLERTNLTKANLQEADLTKANLQGANLTGTQLQGTNLKEANLKRADLKEANLKRADLIDAQLQKAELPLAQLQEAILWKANLQMARLSGAQLQAAHLVEANLQAAVLWNTQLQGANLAKAKLQAAELCFAQLQAANLREAKLQGITSDKALFDSFEERINDRIGEKNELNGAIFEGGLKQENIDFIVADISDKEARKGLRKELIKHIEVNSYSLPDDRGAIIDPYTKEDAEKWISEYKEAMSEVLSLGNDS